MRIRTPSHLILALLASGSPAAAAAPAADGPKVAASSAVAPSAVTPTEFDRAVQPFLAGHCARCHGETAQKGEFRLDTLARDFAGDPAKHWAEVMERISSGQMPPKKEPRPDATEAARVVEWVAARLKEGEAARLAARERVSFHRLTREEYANTVRDLLGVGFDPADPTGLPEDPDWNGFERIGSVLSLSPSHVEKYFVAGEGVLAEALPAKVPAKFVRRKDAIELRGGPDRAAMEAQGIADKVRVDLWPGADLVGGRVGPGQALPAAGEYRVRVQVSGLKPAGGRAPHLAFYAVDLDRMLFEQDVVAPEDKPVVVEFTAHLPAGNQAYRLSNDVPGPPNTPRSGRADPRLPFLSIKDGRRPWQIKLTDEGGQPIWPFLIVDWVEWEGPLGVDGPTYAQRQYLPAEPGNMAQAREGLSRLAERAFRRPVKPAEVDRLVTLVAAEMKNGEKFDAAVKTAMLAVLCSKDFLYLVEGSADSDAAVLTDWELASRLSYFLWSTMPDEPLLAAARDGTLRRPDVLRPHVRRMLQDPRAGRFAEAFARQWLQLRRVGMFPPDKKIYPTYDAYLERSMVGEPVAFFGQVLRENLSLRELLDSDWTMLNARLAEHYGIPGVGASGFVRVGLRPEDHRGGVLSQAAVLSLTSDGTRHRPVHRGKWVLESIVGKPPPPPPANVKPIEPTPVTQPKATVRMKLAAHASDATCAACHAKIDPLGFAFDNFDAIGRWRTEEAVSDGAGQNPKVDASGELPDGRRFADAAGLKKLLAADVDAFNAAFVEKLATFAMRRAMTIDDRADLAAVASKGKAADYRLQDVVDALVTSELFQKR
jgi:mono/diheme cytochrome c family protein